MGGSDVRTLCFLGCGNLGRAILSSLVSQKEGRPVSLPFTRYIACVRSQKSKDIIEQTISGGLVPIEVFLKNNVEAVAKSDVVILGVDPADIEGVLQAPGLRQALRKKLLISIAAGWTREKLESTLYDGEATSEHDGNGRAWVVRTLPNIAAVVSQSLTAIEISEPAIPADLLNLTEAIFEQVGRTVRISPKTMNATTAVGGSTPAFFAVVCDALVDAAVAVGVPRNSARLMISQSMLGTATMLVEGMSPAELRDQGTSPEGCTIAGLMVMEENGVRGHMARALREAVTVARLMGTVEHVNDTRH